MSLFEYQPGVQVIYNVTDTAHLEEAYMRDLYFERIGKNLQHACNELDKIINQLKSEEKAESEVSNG